MITCKEETLSPYASFSKKAIREKEEKTFWPPFKEDLERVIHSKALRRYSDKTQVVYLVNNDHITHRGYHVQCVSSFARGIAHHLGLNSDLVEAIALGHDVGHPPFGHEGEGYLSEVCQQHGQPAFSHSSQSCRLFRLIEPLNLTLETLDGFLCHDGGMKSRIQKPKKDKTFSDHFLDLDMRKIDPECDLAPKTLEGCLVKLCDSVSYIAKDLEDACNLKIITKDDIPDTVLGKGNLEILQTAAKDLITESVGKEHIAFSEEVFSALLTLRHFNFERIYTYGPLKSESQKIKNAYRQLFQLLVQDYERKKKESILYKHFLHSKTEAYLDETNHFGYVRDFIAGMTDRYFVSLLSTLVIPQTIRVFDDATCS